MVDSKEFRARVKVFFKFEKNEWIGLLAASLAAAFIFSFRDWGEDQFNLAVGLSNLLVVFLIAIISFTFRSSCQKLFALSQGYKAKFKVWWNGLILSVVIVFASLGKAPVLLLGGATVIFMSKQRIGEFRHGFSYRHNGIVALFGIIGNFILAILFAIGLFAVPNSYFFSKGLLLNLVVGFCAFLPFPQLDGLHIYFGSRIMYYVSLITYLVLGILLLTGWRAALVVVIVVASILGVLGLLLRSEK